MKITTAAESMHYAIFAIYLSSDKLIYRPRFL